MLVILTMIAPNNADQKPATTKSSSNAATSPNIAAFRTKRKKPIVTMVNGRVIRKAIGRTIALTNPSRNAARMKLKVPSIETPGTRRDARKRPSIMISVRMKIPCMGAL